MSRLTTENLLQKEQTTMHQCQTALPGEWIDPHGEKQARIPTWAQIVIAEALPQITQQLGYAIVEREILPSELIGIVDSKPEQCVVEEADENMLSDNGSLVMVGPRVLLIDDRTPNFLRAALRQQRDERDVLCIYTRNGSEEGIASIRIQVRTLT